MAIVNITFSFSIYANQSVQVGDTIYYYHGGSSNGHGGL